MLSRRVASSISPRCSESDGAVSVEDECDRESLHGPQLAEQLCVRVVQLLETNPGGLEQVGGGIRVVLGASGAAIAGT